MVTQLKNSNCDTTEKLQLWEKKKNSKTLNVTKLKVWQNPRIQIKYKNLKTQIVTKLQNSNGVKNSNFDETQIVMKFKNWNIDET